MRTNMTDIDSMDNRAITRVQRMADDGYPDAANALDKLDDMARAINHVRKDCHTLVRINQQYRLKIDLNESIPMMVGQFIDTRY